MNMIWWAGEWRSNEWASKWTPNDWGNIYKLMKKVAGVMKEDEWNDEEK